MVLPCIKKYIVTLLFLISIINCSKNKIFQLTENANIEGRNIFINIENFKQKKENENMVKVNDREDIVIAYIVYPYIDSNEGLLEFTGVANDNIGIKKIEVKNNSNSYQSVNGTNVWNVSIPIKLGKNEITFKLISKDSHTYFKKINIHYLWKKMKYFPLFNMRMFYSNVVLDDDKIYVLGGVSMLNDRTAYYLYKNALLMKQGLPEVPDNIYNSCVGKYNNQFFLITGGNNENLSDALNKIFIYKKNDSIWENIDTPIIDHGLSFARSFAGCVQYNNKLYIYGGIDIDKNPSDDLWSFDLTNNNYDETNWNKESDIGQFLFNSPLVVSDNQLLIMGGSTDINTLTSDRNIYQYNLITKNITIKNKLIYNRSNYKAFKIGGKVYIFGGAITTNTENGLQKMMVKKTEVYDIQNNTIKELREMPEGLSTMGAVSDGEKIYVVNSLNEQYITSAYIYIYYPLLDDLNN